MNYGDKGLTSFCGHVKGVRMTRSQCHHMTLLSNHYRGGDSMLSRDDTLSQHMTLASSFYDIVPIQTPPTVICL
jgi:hypothetical protein